MQWQAIKTNVHSWTQCIVQQLVSCIFTASCFINDVFSRNSTPWFLLPTCQCLSLPLMFDCNKMKFGLWSCNEYFFVEVQVCIDWWWSEKCFCDDIGFAAFSLFVFYQRYVDATLLVSFHCLLADASVCILCLITSRWNLCSEGKIWGKNWSTSAYTARRTTRCSESNSCQELPFIAQHWCWLIGFMPRLHHWCWLIGFMTWCITYVEHVNDPTKAASLDVVEKPFLFTCWSCSKLHGDTTGWSLLTRTLSTLAFMQLSQYQSRESNSGATSAWGSNLGNPSI